MAYVSRSPPISRVGDWRAGLGRCLCSLLPRPFVCECHIISTVPRFQSPPRRTQRADFPPCAHLFASRQGLWDLHPHHSGLPSASPPELSWRYAGFIKPAASQPSKPPSVLSPFAQLRCYLRWGDVSAISSEGVTPPSSLLRAHVPLPLGSLLLRHLASFEESWQVVRSPCCPPGASRRYL